MAPQGPTTVLLVMGDALARAMTDALQPRRGAPGARTYLSTQIADVRDAMAMHAIERFDAVVLDTTDLSDTTGSADAAVRLVVDVHHAAPDVPIVALTSADDEALGRRLVDAGAQDFLAIDDIHEAVVRRTLRHAAERQRLVDSLQGLALTDHLTGLYNRRGLELIGGQMIDQARRSGQEVSVMFADLDGLKQVNDQDGHEAGDALIVAAADLLRGELRSADVVARLGGDEFAALLLDADREAVSRRLRSTLATVRDRRLQMSFAIATEQAATVDLQILLDRADEAMYVQKRQRRRGRAGPDQGRGDVTGRS